MSDHTHTEGLHYIEIDYQTEYRCEANLPESLRNWSEQAAFPRNAPPSLRDTPDYKGIRLCFRHDYLQVSEFGYEGKKDTYGRAIPSAKAWLIPFDRFESGLRKLEPLRTAIAADAKPQANLSTPGGWRRALSHTELSDVQLAACLYGLFQKMPVRVYGPQSRRLLHWFDALFLLGPMVAREAWSSYVYAESPDTEPFTLMSGEMPRVKRSFWQKLTGSQSGDGAVRIQADTNEIQGATPGKNEMEKLEAALGFLRMDEQAGALSLDRFFALQNMLLALWAMGKLVPGLPKISEEFKPDPSNPKHLCAIFIESRK